MKKKYSVLLVDDSDDDRLFMRRVLDENPRFVIIGEVVDGEEAIEYLRGENRFCDREKYPFPDVVLLDLKMPRVTGHEVLGWLQTQTFDDLFVAVVSGSYLPNDIEKSLELGAHVHYEKTALQDEQEGMVRALEQLLGKKSR
ncbi:MAG TPA: response regulator [Verrucomicrobiae bacterium]|jgi:CheY-like chemotaxis protein|nr:response regulator [Verrucomicrobiae bacterium]